MGGAEPASPSFAEKESQGRCSMDPAFVLARDSRRLVVRNMVLWLGTALLALVLIGSASRPITAGAQNDGRRQVAGGWKTIIEGGGPGLVPVTTVLAFHANRQ